MSRRRTGDFSRVYVLSGVGIEQVQVSRTAHERNRGTIAADDGATRASTRRSRAGSIDAQSVRKSAEGVVPIATSGYDCHKRVSGRKRHIAVDTLGLLCTVIATPADLHDAYATPALLYAAAEHGIRHVWADQAYHVHRTITAAKHLLDITLDIVFRPETGPGFHVLPRRWVVERTFAWISRRRRCARDYERRLDHHEAMVYWAAILQMTRHRARLS